MRKKNLLNKIMSWKKLWFMYLFKKDVSGRFLGLDILLNISSSERFLNKRSCDIKVYF